MKKMYNAPKMDCVALSATDVIATSNGIGGIQAGNDGGNTQYGEVNGIRNRT